MTMRINDCEITLVALSVSYSGPNLAGNDIGAVLWQILNIIVSDCRIYDQFATFPTLISKYQGLSNAGQRQCIHVFLCIGRVI